jgi:RNA polymerase sigma-70 factor (ECF subfamily)
MDFKAIKQIKQMINAVPNSPSQYSEPPPNDGVATSMDVLVTHLEVAYNLARWLLRNDTEAEDAVQEAFLRAIHHFKGFRGGDGRAWLLAIVRNGCYDRLRQSAAHNHSIFDEKNHFASPRTPNQEASLLRQEETAAVRLALENLPPQLREVLILREFEEMAYKQIAAILQVPIGTVMSRLSRARQQLQQVVFAKGEAKETDVNLR